MTKTQMPNRKTTDVPEASGSTASDFVRAAQNLEALRKVVSALQSQQHELYYANNKARVSYEKLLKRNAALNNTIDRELRVARVKEQNLLELIMEKVGNSDRLIVAGGCR